MPMEATQEKAPAAQQEMSEDCKSLLKIWELSASISEDGQKVELYDWDGEFRVTVRREINVQDLLVLLRYGNHMFDIGRKSGEENIKASFRALMGAAAENPKA